MMRIFDSMSLLKKSILHENADEEKSIVTAVTVTTVTIDKRSEPMKFYDRTDELEALKKIEKTSVRYAQMTIITGRRRIGKTTLIRKAFTEIPFVYFLWEKE